MPKKKTNPEENPTATTPAAPAVKRRAPAKKKAAAPADTANDSGANGRPEPTHAEIAEAAYFRSLRRGGGGGGGEFSDWIEAENELKGRRR